VVIGVADHSGRRRYTAVDLVWLSLIQCLRDTGMAIAEIKGIEDGPHGRVPAGASRWTLNLREVAWKRVDGGGTWCVFESPVAPSPTLGLGVHILFPGDTPKQVPRRGSARGPPCARLYLPDPAAARHGAAVERESASAADVYADHPPIEEASCPWPLPEPGRPERCSPQARVAEMVRAAARMRIPP